MDQNTLSFRFIRNHKRKEVEGPDTESFMDLVSTTSFLTQYSKQCCPDTKISNFDLIPLNNIIIPLLPRKQLAQHSGHNFRFSL